MKTVSPYVHGFSNGASLTTDLFGGRLDARYVKAVSSRYSSTDKETNDYTRGQKQGLAISVVIALLALLFMALTAMLWNLPWITAAIMIIWQILSVGNAIYAIKYEREFISGRV